MKVDIFSELVREHVGLSGMLGYNRRLKRLKLVRSDRDRQCCFGTTSHCLGRLDQILKCGKGARWLLCETQNCFVQVLLIVFEGGFDRAHLEDVDVFFEQVLL